MTAQMMEMFEFQGQTWSICSPGPGAPSNRYLGIETVMASTACISGRSDTFSISDDMHLVLKQIEVRLAEDKKYKDYVPRGARREDLDEFESMGLTTRFIFDDLKLDFTGTLVLARELNHSYYVHMGRQLANRFEQRANLEFKNGVLVSSAFEHGSSPDPFWRRPAFFSLVLLAVIMSLWLTRCFRAAVP